MSMTRGERAIEAIKCHKAEVYGDNAPDFAADFEMYQAIDLLPEDYIPPGEEQMNHSAYQARKDSQEAVDLLRSALVAMDGSLTDKAKDGLRDEINAFIKKATTRPPIEPGKRILAQVAVDGVIFYETSPEPTDSKEFMKSVKEVLRGLPRMWEEGWKRGQK